jgi:caffeoyl-CoA O-methyltransferase
MGPVRPILGVALLGVASVAFAMGLSHRACQLSVGSTAEPLQARDGITDHQGPGLAFAPWNASAGVNREELVAGQGAARLWVAQGAPAEPARQPRPQGRPASLSAMTLEKPPLPKDDGERRILAVLQAMAQEGGVPHVPERDGRFLRQMVEATGARYVVELGTANGYSALWMALALRKTGGKLYTHEIDLDRIETARENFRKAGVEDIIEIIPGDAHETVTRHRGPIDLLFIDADKEGYLDYLQKLLPVVRPGGLILSHNMNYPKPDPKFVEAITTNPDLETTFVFMDAAGIGVTLKKR